MARIVFFGTPQFAVPFLQALADDARFEIVGVVAQPDAPKGRKQELTSPPIAQFAKERGLTLFQPAKIKKNESFITALRELQADAFVVVAYGKILSETILEIPPHGVVNVHPSLLPLYRGPSPMQAAIRNGDLETGISIMKIDEQMDHGPILDQEKIKLHHDMTATDLEAAVHEKGPRLLLKTLYEYIAGNIAPSPQKDDHATYCGLLTRADGFVQPTDLAQTVWNKWRAYYPWPGVTLTLISGKKYKIHDCEWVGTQESDQDTLALKVLNKQLLLVAKDGALNIKTIQEEGRSPIGAEDFIHALAGQQWQEHLKEM